MVDLTSRFHPDSKDVSTWYVIINSATGKYYLIASNVGKKPYLIVNFVKKQKVNNIKGKCWSICFSDTMGFRVQTEKVFCIAISAGRMFCQIILIFEYD